jgi:formimidoylglutamate deiminase
VKLRFEHALLPDGIHADVAVEIADGRVVAVGAPLGEERRVAGLALPGMPNLHSHAFQRAMAGSAEVASGAEHSFWGWREVMYRFVERLAPEDVAAIAAFAYLEMLEAGYTEVAEFHYLHHRPDGGAYAEPTALGDAVRAGAWTAGIRHLLLPTLYQQGSFAGQPLAGSQRRFANATDGFLRLLESYAARAVGLESTGVALHSLRAVPRPALEEVCATLAARWPGMPVHVHVAEQQREVDECIRHSGQRPVEHLLGTGFVTRRWCLVHATHVTDAELAALGASGAVAGLCPTTECNLGDGRFPLDDFLGHGGRFGIGSDSHVTLDPREELRGLEYTLRAWRERRVIAVAPGSPHCGTFLYQAALAGGAQACGAERHGFAPGARADFIVLDTDRPEFAGVAPAALVDAYVFAPRPHALREVWVAGRAVIEGGRHPAREEIAARYREALARLVAG